MPSTHVLAASLLLSAAAAACVPLGPVSTSTGVSPIAHGRPGVDLQAGPVPGVYVSDATRDQADRDGGSALPQLAAAFEPDRLIGVPGLVFGATLVGDNQAQFLPFVGWRGPIDAAGDFALAVVGFGTRMADSADQAEVDLTRAGAEVVVDFNLSGRSRVAELHVVAGGSAQGVWADGAYCVDDDGHGVDCNEPDDPTIDGSLSAVYPAGRAGLALDFVRNRSSFFHGGRFELTVGGGVMPRVVNGDQNGRQSYSSAGFTLTLGFGEK